MKYLKFLLIVIVDIGLFFLLVFILMGYEDFYNESQGAYYSLSSMTTLQKIAWISYILWIVINIAALIYFGYKYIFKKMIKTFFK